MGDTAAMTSSQASTMMEASMATSAMSSIVETTGQIGAIKAQGDYQSSLANANAAMGRLKASQTLQAGDIAASRRDMQARGQIGTARAIGGASGIDVNTGSSAMTQSDIGTAGLQDELTIRNNTARQAWGYQTQAIEDTYAGQFSKLAAASKVQQSIATGGLQAVSGPLGIYANYLRWSRYMGGGGGGASSGLVMPWTMGATTPQANDASSTFDMRTG